MPRKHIQKDQTCTFCLTPLASQSISSYGGRIQVDCSCCGVFHITPTAVEMASSWDLELDEFQWTAIAYRIRRISEGGSVPEISSNLLNRLRDTATLPLVDEIIDEAVLWIGSHTRHPGYLHELKYPEFKALLGATDESAYNQILQSLLASNWIDGQLTSFVADTTNKLEQCQLTPAGWKYFRELSKARVDSRHAFMAMKYGDDQLDTIVEQHFAPAVRRTGLELRRLDQGQPAGLIDDQLRVQIRTSRLLICDLTHGNRGAYWEAGFAEGLGRPVIYTCREDVFGNSTHEHHPHFDTNHFVTVLWNAEAPQTAAQRLVDTIRATLPGEVIMQN